MLNKIAKLIGVGAIIGLSGLSTWANRIDVFYEGGPTLVAEGIDGVELPQELSDPSHDLWDEYDPYVKFVGIRLNLPQELIADCEDKYWKIHDEALIQELEEAVSSEEKFHLWCDNQEDTEYNLLKTRNLCRSCAYMLKIANEKNYLVPGNFCKRIELHSILDEIYLKGAVRCMPDYTTPLGKYIKSLQRKIESCFFYEENNEED